MNGPKIRLSCARWIVSLAIIAVLAFCDVGRANNEIFPATGAAQQAVNWKDGYFYINGKPTFLTSGEMHYTRIARDLWRDRIWRAKQMGFNCVQTYVFWNSSEPTEGKWDFTGPNDLDAWLSAVQEMGMYATVRVGPYSCAEWDDGGLPAWLLAKPGVTLRDGGVFEENARQQLDQVEKIVAKHQIHRGGSVILVQLENEHPRGWGTDESFPYLKRMVEQARANGLEIPLFLSGLHHGADPSGEKPYVVGSSPWFTTEFWTGWIGKYGDMDAGMLAEKIRGTWKIIAFGGAGYDYYMVHGGTNFGYSGHSLDATYDYSAPIGESGQFNNFYWYARRAAYFAQSFSPLLTSSHNDPELAEKTASGLRVTARTSAKEGSIVFLDAFYTRGHTTWISPDPSAYAAPPADAGGTVHMRVAVNGAQLPAGGNFTVTPTQPQTLLLNIPWTENATFSVVCANIFLRHSIGNVDYWICYGTPGDAGEIQLQRKASADLPSRFQFTYPSDDSVKEIAVSSGDGHDAKILVMNTQRTQRTWLAGESLYIGPSFVLPSGQMEFEPGGGKAVVYSANGKQDVVQPAEDAPAPPALANWTWRSADEESKSNASIDGWSESTGPQELATYDGFANRYGWYRTTLHRDQAGPISLHFSGQGGKAIAFLNGELTTFAQLPAKAGDNELAILVKANPRPTLYNVIGSIGDMVARGLWGSVSTDRSPIVSAVKWQQTAAGVKPPTAANASMIAASDSGWRDIDLANGTRITLKPGNTLLRGVFDVSAGDVDSIISASGFKGTQIDRYLNGERLAGPSVDASALLKPGRNVLVLSVNEKSATSGTPDAIQLWHNDPVSRAKWYFHPGLAGLDETALIGTVTNWKAFLDRPWQSGGHQSNDRPIFWHTTFEFHPNPRMVQTIGLMTEGLKSGHVWLNGHNLGECPQKIPLYMPECWINDGANDLVVFDMFGGEPDHLKLKTYEARIVTDGK